VATEQIQTSAPTAEEAATWEGWRLDDLRGGKTGTVEGVYCDAETGEGVWLGVRMGRFGHRSVLPLGHCVGLAGRVWAPYDRDDIRAAPRVDPGQSLTREDEIYLLEAFGLPTDSGRGAEVSGRPANSETSKPA
jgi:hypothetical protein